MRKQDQDEESTVSISDSKEAFVTSLKVFIKGEFQKVNADLKDIRRNWGALDLHLTSIEGKLNGLESCVGQLQGDILAVNCKFGVARKKIFDSRNHS